MFLTMPCKNVYILAFSSAIINQGEPFEVYCTASLTVLVCSFLLPCRALGCRSPLSSGQQRISPPPSCAPEMMQLHHLYVCSCLWPPVPGCPYSLWQVSFHALPAVFTLSHLLLTLISIDILTVTMMRIEPVAVVPDGSMYLSRHQEHI